MDQMKTSTYADGFQLRGTFQDRMEIRARIKRAVASARQPETRWNRAQLFEYIEGQYLQIGYSIEAARDLARMQTHLV